MSLNNIEYTNRFEYTNRIKTITDTSFKLILIIQRLRYVALYLTLGLGMVFYILYEKGNTFFMSSGGKLYRNKLGCPEIYDIDKAYHKNKKAF